MSTDELKQYYLIDEEDPAFKKIYKSLVEVYKDEIYNLPKEVNRERNRIIERVKMILYRSKVNDIIDYLSYNTELRIPILERRRKNNLGKNVYRDKMALRNRITKDEIERITNELGLLIEEIIDKA